MTFPEETQRWTGFEDCDYLRPFFEEPVVGDASSPEQTRVINESKKQTGCDITSGGTLTRCASEKL